MDNMENEVEQNRRWYEFAEAAVYVGISEDKLRNRHRTGTGPAYVKPSHKTVLFEQAALDAWITSWRRCARPTRA